MAMGSMAPAFSTVALSSLILVYFVYIIRQYLPSLVRESTLFNHVILIATHWEWAFDFLLCYSLFPNYNYVPKTPGMGEEAGACDCYEWKRAAWADGGECSVCLCNVEEGEEIGELRCGHFFHRFCLETWVGSYRHLTCPLCRPSLAPVARFDSELGRELVVLFDFCSFRSSRHRDRLWLR